MSEPKFPLAEGVALSPRWQRDVETLAKSLKLTNPTELLAQWEWFVQRMKRDGEVFEVAAVADYLLREIYRFYAAEIERQARMLAAMERDPRVPEGEKGRAKQMYEAQLAHQKNVWQVMPDLRRILGEVEAG
ncbi:MAG TPA: hypothetical protein VLL52_13445 [Anaerolineae bacterium]|nr:hypothetical protein [Anaerolineae bacterium]